MNLQIFFQISQECIYQTFLHLRYLFAGFIASRSSITIEILLVPLGIPDKESCGLIPFPPLFLQALSLIILPSRILSDESAISPNEFCAENIRIKKERINSLWNIKNPPLTFSKLKENIIFIKSLLHLKVVYLNFQALTEINCELKF